MKKLNIGFISILPGLALILASFPVVFAQETSAEFTLEEITVTAEKRVTDVQKTALAVEAVSGEDISQKAIGNISDLLDGLTAVKVMGGPQGGKIFIRGIGSNIDTNLASPSVGLQKDNVYMGQAEAVMGALYDIDRVEVLYGPQGTMYGKNSAGGQVNVITKNPTDTFESNANLSMGAYNLMSYGVALNVPFSPQWAARLALDKQTHDGYISDGSGSADKFSARVKLSYKPTSKVSLLLTAERTDDKSTNMNTVPVPGSAGNLAKLGPPPAFGYTVPDEYNADGERIPDGQSDDVIMPDPDNPGQFINGSNGIADIIDTGWEQPVAGDEWSNDIYHPAPVNNSIYQTLVLEANVDMGFSNLTIIPTFNKNKRILWSELIMGTSRGDDLMEQSFKEDQFTGEVRLASPSDSKLIWTVGGYYYKSDNQPINVTEQDLLDQAEDIWVNGADTGRGPPTPAGLQDNAFTANYRVPQDGIAAFAQAQYPFTDRFRVTGGIRWNNDNNNLQYRIVVYDVTADGQYADTYYPLAVETPDGRMQYDSGIIDYTVESSPLTYKAGVEYDLDANKMLYANFTTGYKAGGLNIQGVTPPQAYDPEEVYDYSAGIKSRFMNNQLQLNAEAYYYIYKGMQQQCQVAGIWDPVRQQNVEAMIIVNADQGTSAGLEVNLDWMITASDRLTVSASYMQTEFGALTLPASPWYPNTTDKTGDPLPKAPPLSGTLGYEHAFGLDNGATLTPRFQTKVSAGFDNTHETYLAGSHTDAYSMSDFYLTYVGTSGNYSVAAWVKNIENVAVTDYVFPQYRRILMEPRTSGITFNISF
jgi:iron complex outermembrane recepter protein